MRSGGSKEEDFRREAIWQAIYETYPMSWIASR
jgi:hypothetical protein